MMPTAMPPWDDANSLDTAETAFSWDGFELLNIETSDFMASAKEIEQIYGSEAMAWAAEASQNSSKLQIRNHDCMWSGTCGDQSHPGKLGGCGRYHHGPAVVVKEEAQFNTVTAVAAASLNSQKTTILTPSNSINIGNNNSNATTTPKINPIKAAQIPAGRSLLINPRIKQQQLQQQQQQINRVPTVSTADFLRERESAMPLHHHTRPDTPLSLDDDPPEFKHNIDLATCTIGSNRLSLTSSRQQQLQQQQHHFNHLHHHNSSHDDASSSRIINLLKAQLEDTDSGSLRSPYMTSSSGDIGSLTDLLKDLDEIDGDREDPEEEEEDSSSHGDEEDSDTDDCSRSSKGGGSSISGGYTHAHHQEMSPTSSSSSSSSSSSYEYQGTHVGDHSYTLPKKRYNPTELGVQTPSDSEEEIDVVSIGEKNLPTNPTSRNKRALELRVSQKIARKNGSGAGVAPGSGSSSSGSAHHHRRRHSDDDGYHHHHNGHAGSSQTTSPSKVGLSPNYLTPASSTSISGTNTPLPGNSRKRPSKDDHRGSKNRGHQQHHRSKKQRPSGSPGKHHHHQQQLQQQQQHLQKPSSDSSEEQETLEKRNLHNDMERQRRIGLKNLFEELKRQIPNLREKERAPKVNILREAANLCNRLNREQEQLNALRKQQQRLYARVRQLRTSLHSQRRTMD